MTWTPQQPSTPGWDVPADDQTIWAQLDPNANQTLWDTLQGGTVWDLPGLTIWDLKLVDTDDWTKQ